MLPYFTRYYGNPDSPHEAGKLARDGIEQARRQVANLIRAGDKGSVIFTSGGTESNNMAFRVLNRHPEVMGVNVITSKTEHKSVLEPAKESGASTIKFLKPGKKGYISKDDLGSDEIPAFTLVSLMYVNNETGMVNDVYDIGKAIRNVNNPNVWFHVDCVQAAGSVPIDVLEMNADMVSISAHKLHGPKGVGCLWISDRLKECMNAEDPALKLILGGSQEYGYRAGTMNVPGIVGFGKAAEIASEANNLIYDDLAKIFETELERHCSEMNIKYNVNNFTQDHHCNKVLSITFPLADAETIVLLASRNGLCISAGAACNSESSEPSYVLTNSGISDDLARNTVRVSFSYYNSYSDVTQGARILANAVDEVLKLNLTDAVG